MNPIGMNPGVIPLGSSADQSRSAAQAFVASQPLISTISYVHRKSVLGRIAVRDSDSSTCESSPLIHRLGANNMLWKLNQMISKHTISIHPKKSMHLRSAGIILAMTAALAGCALDPSKIGRIDGLPIAAKESVAELAWGSAKAYPNQIITAWSYHVLEIDGKPFPEGKAVVQLVPGEHSVKVACGGRFGARDTGWFNAEATTTVTVAAGKRYFAWIGTRPIQTKVTTDRTGSSIETSSGQCWVNGFNETNPFFVIS